MMNRFVPMTVLLVGLVGCGGETDSAQGQFGSRGGGRVQLTTETSVHAYRAENRPISTYILTNTTLESIRKVSVYSRTSAMVSTLSIEEGAMVKTGDLLATLDDREIRNELDQARIAVDQSQLSLEQAGVRAQLSATNFERALSLYDQKLTSKQEFDQAALTNRTDELAYETAEQALGSARARLEAAQIQLEYTEIRSPFDGVITARMIEIGDRLGANQEVFWLEEFPPLWARIFVPERNLPQLREGQLADIKVETYGERTFRGRIKMISPTIDAETGTVKVTLELDQPQGMLKPGMFGTVYIATETHADALVISKKAVVRERDLNHVFVVTDDNTVEKREITIGFSEEDYVEVLTGLERGEAVVTVGTEVLADGYPVSILAWENSDEAPRLLADNPNAPTGSESEGERQEAGDRRPGEGTRGREASGGQGGRSGGMAAALERMMQNPEFKAAYDAKLKEDPEIATNQEKRTAFFREYMQQRRGGQGQGGGGRGRRRP